VATQVYRVAHVLTAAASPVARLQAIDEDGHELRLELPVALVQRIAPGHVLVLNWSVHALPEPLAPAAVQNGPPVAADQAPLTSAASPRAVDDAFMDLMSRVRRGTSAASTTPTTSTTPPASQTRGELEINDEFNTLLGSARTKG
jgi:hypothetical protein